MQNGDFETDTPKQEITRPLDTVDVELAVVGGGGSPESAEPLKEDESAGE